MPDFELSIIVPTLNDADSLGSLLRDLRQQRKVRYEIIVVDGGSNDGTRMLLENICKQTGVNVKIIQSQSGRGKQMNRGAAAAEANELLFLHADSSLEDPLLLSNALYVLRSQRTIVKHDQSAGHFGLRFDRQQPHPSPGYFFYESKTRLNRLDTINGDQGFMLSKRFFHELGGFDESLGYMEDFRLARRIFEHGEWIALPGTLTTSARRFESEGLRRRQILNAFLCNFEHIGLTEFFAEAADAYRAQDKSGALDLKPFFLLIHRITKRIGFRRSERLWYRTGAYVADNAWQLAFAWDCRRNFAKQLPPGEDPTPALAFYDRWLKPAIDSPPGHLIAAGLTFIWFYSTLLLMILRK